MRGAHAAKPPRGPAPNGKVLMVKTREQAQEELQAERQRLGDPFLTTPSQDNPEAQAQQSFEPGPGDHARQTPQPEAQATPPAPEQQQQPDTTAAQQTGSPPDADPEKPSAPDNQPAEERDWKAEAERAQQEAEKLRKSYQHLRPQWDKTKQENRRLQEQLDAYQAAFSGAKPWPEASPAAGEPPRQAQPQAQPGPSTDQQAAQEQQVRDDILARMEQEYGPDYAREHAQMAAEVAQRVVAEKLDEFRQQIDPTLTNLHQHVRDTEAEREEAARQSYLNSLGQQVPDWFNLVQEPDFAVWLDQNPGAYTVLYGGPGNNPVGTPAEAAEVMERYRSVVHGSAQANGNGNGHAGTGPGTNGAQATGLPGQHDPAAAQQRVDNAAQADQGQVHASNPAVPATGNYLLLSELNKRFEATKNNPAEFRKVRQEMDKALEEGRLYDDVRGRPPTAY